MLETFQQQIPGKTASAPETELHCQQSLNSNRDPGDKNWKAIMAYPSDAVLDKTLTVKTQLCTEPVEMEH